MYVATLRYKKEFRKVLEKRQHKLKCFYGLSMFLVDKFLKQIVRRTDHTDIAIKALKVKENIGKEKYLYIVEKVGMSAFILFIVLVVSLLVNINEHNKKSQINVVERNRQYDLVIEKIDGETTQIMLDIPERELSKEEKDGILDAAERDLFQVMLGENESLDNICYRLNLVSSIGQEGVAVSWSIEDSTVIDYEGFIGEDVGEEGQIIQLEATLMFDNEIRTVSFSANIFPSKEKKDIRKHLEEYVENNDLSKDKVELPKSIDGVAVKYYRPVKNLSESIVVIGIILAFVIFFLKDKDLKKELKNRNKQLIRDYPEIISKILMYYGAGLSIKMTFEEIVKEYEREKERDKYLFKYAYEEMVITLNKMRTGVSERLAIGEYGKSCGLHCYIKLANIIEQNLKRGTKEITTALREELSNAVNNRKNSGLKEGNEISTKLLGPMLIMLMVAIVIVIAPAFMSMKF